jgi:hypothetical protein
MRLLFRDIIAAWLDRTPVFGLVILQAVRIGIPIIKALHETPG